MKAELEKRNEDMLQQKLDNLNGLDEFKRDLLLKWRYLREKELENQRLIKKVEAQSELTVAKSSQELTGEAAEILLLENYKEFSILYL